MTSHFVSYNGHDRAWAEWIGQQIEGLGHTTVLQAWDFEIGANFIAAMHTALQSCDKLVMVLSRHYLAARYTNEEWQAAFALRQRIIPLRIDDCQPPGLLAPLAYADLHGLDQAAAARAVRDAIDPPGRPKGPVPFPGGSSKP